MLAAVGSDAYKIVLVLHIICAIVGFGTVFLNGIYGAQSKARKGSEGLAIAESNYLVSMIGEYFIYAVLGFGIALVLIGDDAWSFGDTWIILSMILFVLSLGVAHGLLYPRIRKMLDLQRELVAMGEPPASAAAFYYQQARARRGSEGIAIIEAYRLVGKVATYFMVVVLLLGIALVLMSDDAISFGDTWILLSLTVLILAMGMAGALLTPRERRALDLQREIETLGDANATAQTAELVKLDKQMTIMGTALNVAVVLILVFMVFKP